MPVQIGQKPDHGFDRPVGMLGDCHRRIERFLAVLVRLAAKFEGQELDTEQRRALGAALVYFRTSGPIHTADEEQSLFPRLRQLEDARVKAALAEVERLERDHRFVEPLHAEVDELGSEWLSAGRLSGERAARLRELTERLSTLYAEHIQVEDRQLFPLAAEVLPDAVQASIGAEMANRRHVQIAPLENQRS